MLHTLAGAASSLAAQSSAWWVDVGAAAVQQPLGTARQAAIVGAGGVREGVFGPAKNGRRGVWSVAVDAAFTVAQDSVDAAQAVMRASLTPSRFSWSTSDVELSATALGISLPGTNGSQSAAFQQAVRRGAWQLFSSGGVGRTSRSANHSEATVVRGGISGTRRTFVGALTVQRATTTDFELMEAAGFTLTRRAPTYVLRDARIDLHWRASAVQFTASGTSRIGRGATSGATRALAGTATWPLTPTLHLIAQGGRQLADPLRGVPQADYVGLAARWQRRTTPPLSSSTTPVVRNAESTLEPHASGATMIVRVSAPATAVVEIASSATQWVSSPMTREGEQFVARLLLSSGTHRVAVRVNGGRWRAPRGLVPVNDEFGGAAGIVIVP